MPDETAPMRSANLAQVAQAQLDAARAAPSGRTTTTPYG